MFGLSDNRVIVIRVSVISIIYRLPTGNPCSNFSAGAKHRI